MPKILPDRIGTCTVCRTQNVKLHHGECEECSNALAAHRHYTSGQMPEPAPQRVYRVAAMRR